jgi:ParB family chromosome partitioning protein
MDNRGTKDEVGAIIEMSPFRCCMWSLHDRLEEYLTEETCKAELGSFEKNGQLVPVLGRALHGNPDFDVELIFGARRLFVAKTLNRPIKIQIRAMGDREAILAMDVENRHRKDVSPYERGISYARWLRSGHFNSQDEIAQALKVSSAQISRLLKLARLPSVVVGAFASPTDICEGWGSDLVDMWDDPNTKPQVARRARSIGAMPVRPTAQDVYRSLVSLSPLKRRRSGTRDEVVSDGRGTPLFRVRPQQKWIAVLLPREHCGEHHLQAIKQAITSVLEVMPLRSRSPDLAISAEAT